MNNYVQVSSEADREIMFVRAIVSYLSMHLNQALKITIMHNGAICPKTNAQANICLRSTDYHIWLNICKSEETQTGVVRISPKKGVTISRLQTEICNSLKRIAKTYALHIKPNKACSEIPIIKSKKTKNTQRKVSNMTKITIELSQKLMLIWQALDKYAGDDLIIPNDKRDIILKESGCNKPNFNFHTTKLRQLGILVSGKHGILQLAPDIKVIAKSKQAKKAPVQPKNTQTSSKCTATTKETQSLAPPPIKTQGSIPQKLVTLLENGSSTIEIVDAILADLRVADVPTIGKMLDVAITIHNDPRCPRFEKTEAGNRAYLEV